MSDRGHIVGKYATLQRWHIQLVGGNIVQQLQRWVRMSGGRQYNADGTGVYLWPIQRERLVDMRELCRRLCLWRYYSTVDMSSREV